MDLISVVVPVYNVEQYLGRCVDSVRKQSYQNLEIILVDDGSPDKCPRMCDEYAAQDSRIKVIHKVNAGLGMARNTGIENATGDYICFVDSDDYIHSDMIRNAYECMQRESVDIVLYGMSRVNDEEKILSVNIPNPPQKTFVGEEIIDILLPGILVRNPHTGADMGIASSACTIMFSMNLIRKANWKFVSEREYISEDVYSLLILFKHINSAAVLREALYFYRVNQNSLTKTYRDDRYEKARSFYNQSLQLCEKLEYPKVVRYACTGPYMGSTIDALKQIVINEKSIFGARKHLKVILNDRVLQEVLTDKLKIKERFSVKMLFWTMKSKCYVICYILVKLHCIRTTR